MKKILACCLLWIALGFFSSKALAGAVTLSWTPPTQNEDGTALIDLEGYFIYYGTSSGNYPESVRVIQKTATSYVIEDLAPDTYYFVATSYNEANVESRYSNEAVKTVPADPTIPGPPTMLAVEALTVFTIIKRNDRFVLVVVGTVPASTQCDPNQSVNGHHVVPNEEVIWATATGPRPIVVVAQCG